MRLPIKAAFAVAPLALAAATMALADSSGSPGVWRQRRMKRLQSKFGLRDDQTSAIQSAFSADPVSRRQLHLQLRRATSDLNQSASNGGDPATLQGKTAGTADGRGSLLPLTRPLLQAERASSPDAAAALQRSRSISPTTISMMLRVSHSLS